MGLVFRNGNYHRTILAGTYWLLPFDGVYVYDQTKAFAPPVELGLLLRDSRLADLLMVVEVADQQIVLLYENGLLRQVLTPGRYAYWKGVVEYSAIVVDLNKTEITEIADRSVLERREVLPYVRIFTVESYEKGVLYVDGKVSRVLGTGTYYFWKNAVPLKVEKADMRVRLLEISGQEMLTRDKAAIRINYVTQFQVTDVEKALILNKDYEKQLYLIIQLALREYAGTFTLDELLERREAIGSYVMRMVHAEAAALGVELRAGGVRDLILPGEVKEIMNQVLVAQKQAQANVIMRREETASTRSLLNTAKLLEENAMLYKLKEMEYMEKIASRIREISLSSNGQVIDQLRGILTPGK